MMESIERVCGRFSEYGDKPAIFWQGKEYSYNYLHEEICRWEQEIEEKCTRGGRM